MLWYYLLVGICTALFCIGVVKLLSTPFLNLATTSVKQLDIILDATMDEREKDRLILKNLSKLLGRFFFVLLGLIVLLVLSSLPVYFLLHFQPDLHLDLQSWRFYLGMIVGSFVLFLPSKKKSDYSYWSKLLHTIVLDNYSVGKFLLRRALKKKESINTKNSFVIVTGLARGGTTAFTNLLYHPGVFHSISYANMPFLMAPNMWKRVYSPKKVKSKERAHGDKVTFDENAIEALEEYFYKVMLNDSYIEDKTLRQHEIPIEVYEKYMGYQDLFANKKGTRYLAKNNNFILRYPSLRDKNNDFKMAILFRHPVEHANSLKRQHINFERQQKNDPFVLSYMNWLGHYEFGLNQKIFALGKEDISAQYDRDTLDYWLLIWVNYYAYVLSLTLTENDCLIDYQDLLESPEKLKRALNDKWDLSLEENEEEKFAPKKYDTDVIQDLDLLKTAESIFEKLQDKKLILSD